jgi:hypothetical protein
LAAAHRLKIYQAAFGFRDSVVAAANQKAALEAWGARQNLFAEGLARVADDPAAMKAALDHPGTPLTRPLGSSGPFTVGSNEVPVLPDVAKRPTVTRKPDAGPSPAPPDRSRLDAAEAAVREAEAELSGAGREYRSRAEALERERQTTLRRLDSRLSAAKEKAEAARRAFRAAGGGA